MRTMPVALAVAGAFALPAAAHAQSSVTLFGIFDVNYAHLRGAGNGSFCSGGRRLSIAKPSSWRASSPAT